MPLVRLDQVHTVHCVLVGVRSISDYVLVSPAELVRDLRGPGKLLTEVFAKMNHRRDESCIRYAGDLQADFPHRSPDPFRSHMYQTLTYVSGLPC